MNRNENVQNSFHLVYLAMTLIKQFQQTTIPIKGN